MKKTDSKSLQFSKRDLASILVYALIIVWPQASVLVPAIRDVLATYVSPEWVALLMMLISVMGVVAKKFVQDYSKLNK